MQYVTTLPSRVCAYQPFGGSTRSVPSTSTRNSPSIPPFTATTVPSEYVTRMWFSETSPLATDSDIREINQLVDSFNRLFDLQNRQQDELRNLTRYILHDMRTPISHIAIQAERIFDGTANPKTAAGVIADSCNTIVQLFETHSEIASNNSMVEIEKPV